MLQSTIAMAREKPWTGFGLGNFENVYPAYALFDDGAIVNHAHNDWLGPRGALSLPSQPGGFQFAVAGYRGMDIRSDLGGVAAESHSSVDLKRPGERA